MSYKESAMFLFSPTHCSPLQRATRLSSKERKTNFKRVNLQNHSCLPVYTPFRRSSLFGINAQSSGFPALAPSCSAPKWHLGTEPIESQRSEVVGWRLGCGMEGLWGGDWESDENWGALDPCCCRVAMWTAPCMRTTEGKVTHPAMWVSYDIHFQNPQVWLALNPSCEVPCTHMLLCTVPSLCWSTKPSALSFQNPLHALWDPGNQEHHLG